MVETVSDEDHRACSGKPRTARVCGNSRSSESDWKRPSYRERNPNRGLILGAGGLAQVGRRRLTQVPSPQTPKQRRHSLCACSLSTPVCSFIPCSLQETRKVARAHRHALLPRALVDTQRARDCPGDWLPRLAEQISLLIHLNLQVSQVDVRGSPNCKSELDIFLHRYQLRVPTVRGEGPRLRGTNDLHLSL